MKEILNEVKNMVVKQISVFIENKEGRMKKAINTLAQENINIRALSIADTTKYGILRLIVSDNEKAIVVMRLKHMDEAIALLKDSDAHILEKKDIEDL